MSDVCYLGPLKSRLIIITLNKYGIGQGKPVALQYRGQATTFLANDVSPTWEDYAPGTYKNWSYVQMKAIKLT
jgi:hypothetical protein